MSRLTEPQWALIRQIWEYSPDEVSLNVAASRAAEKHGFTAPSKQAVSKKMKIEGWERKASLSGINQAAHRIADRMVDSDGQKVDAKVDATRGPISELEERAESERKRAEVRVRHRQEWQQIAVLRQEALKNRAADVDRSLKGMRLAKLTAETTAIQQSGECKAWGLDELIDPARLRGLSDEQLEALAAGRSI